MSRASLERNAQTAPRIASNNSSPPQARANGSPGDGDAFCSFHEASCGWVATIQAVYNRRGAVTNPTTITVVSGSRGQILSRRQARSAMTPSVASVTGSAIG